METAAFKGIHWSTDGYTKSMPYKKEANMIPFSTFRKPFHFFQTFKVLKISLNFLKVVKTTSNDHCVIPMTYANMSNTTRKRI